MRIQPDRLEETFATQVGERQPLLRGHGRWLTSRLCALGLMVERTTRRRFWAGPPMRAFHRRRAPAPLQPPISSWTGAEIREEIRSGSHQRYFRACRARGYRDLDGHHLRR